MPPGCRDPVRDLPVTEPAQQVDRAGEWPALRQELAEELAMAGLDAARKIVIEGLSDLACDRTCEKAAAHPDATVDLPPIDRETGLRERTLPREDVRVHCVNERSVEIENERTHE